jgi:hypothetical protein
MSETYRVLYQINLRNSASRWLSLYEYITMHGPLNVKFFSYCFLFRYGDYNEIIMCDLAHGLICWTGWTNGRLTEARSIRISFNFLKLHSPYIN